MKIKFLAYCFLFSLLWGAFLLFCGLFNHFDFAKICVTFFSSIYIGYNFGLVSSIKGSIFGILDAFIGGCILLFFTNAIIKNVIKDLI